jgi:uncharacterized protein involved in exopolysaccharide biosynthesis
MHPTSFDDFDSPQLFDVRAAVRKLWTRRLLIVAVTLTVLFAAALYTVTTKPSYTATAAILVDPRDVKTTNIDSVLPGIGADSAAIASQVSVIQSRDFLGEVFAALQLQTDPEYAGGGFASQLIGAIKSSAPPTSEAILQRFLGTVSVEREGLTYVIDIGVKSSDPVKAARIANAIVEHYQASSSAQQSTATTDVTAALNSRIANLQSDVAGAERAVADFRQQHGILDDTTGGTLQSQIDQLTTQILAAKDALNQAQTKYDQAAAAGTSAAALAQLSAVSSSATLDKLRDDYNQRAATLASAEATLGPKHPTIITAKAELARVSALLGQEGARLAKQLKADRNAAQANLDKLQANLATLRQQSGDSDIAQVELRQLQRRPTLPVPCSTTSCSAPPRPRRSRASRRRRCTSSRRPHRRPIRPGPSRCCCCRSAPCSVSCSAPALRCFSAIARRCRRPSRSRPDPTGRAAPLPGSNRSAACRRRAAWPDSTAPAATWSPAAAHPRPSPCRVCCARSSRPCRASAARISSPSRPPMRSWPTPGPTSSPVAWA